MNRVEGIVPPMVTPLLNDDALDLPGIENLVEHLISGGVHGLFLLGTTGEGPSIKQSMRVTLIQKVCDQVQGRIPVWVGLMNTSFREAVELADKAKECGARGLVLAPPSFYKIEQHGLYRLVDQMLDEISLPLYLYNNPGVTQVSFELETVARLLPREGVRGMKDSSGDMIYFQRLRELTEQTETELYMGPEELLMESLIVGGQGGIPGGANIFPELYVAMYKAVTSGDLDKAQNLQRKIMRLTKVVYGGSGFIAEKVVNGIKCALQALDICSAEVSKPLDRASEKKEKKIRELLKTHTRSG
ncbi:dihydrodipicolinate synthase family protein [Halalkalibaculum sp. DA3122]|uniref:dihydrodipicolinate synthase family protein n=1 Tax=Halalkalibaculum sp. DA3122 TaxID=3373607 RepID=UPI003754C6BC